MAVNSAGILRGTADSPQKRQKRDGYETEMELLMHVTVLQ